MLDSLVQFGERIQREATPRMLDGPHWLAVLSKPCTFRVDSAGSGIILLIHPEVTAFVITLVYRGFPNSSVGKESTCNAGDCGSISGSGRSPREGIGYPLQYSWASLVAQLVKNPPAMQETWLPTPVFWPREFHGLYGLWGCKQLGMAEQCSLPFSRGFSQPRDGTQVFFVF